MKFVLVLQFPERKFDDFDEIMALEDALHLYLHGLTEVDGHDFGGDQMNIFIFTQQPKAAFEKTKFIVKAAGMLTDFAAAYRLAAGDDFIRLWPVDAVEPFRVT